MEGIIQGIVLLFLVALLGFVVASWLESKELWNNGVNAVTGRPWIVIEEGGKLQLYDGYHRINLNGPAVHPSITDALRKQRQDAKGRAR